MNNEPSLLQKVYYFIKIKNRWTGIDELTYEQQFKDFDNNMLVNAAQQLMDCGALKPNEDVTNVSLYTKMMATTDYYSLDDFLRKNRTPITTAKTPKYKWTKSNIEMLAIIVTIVAGLIAIYEFLIKKSN